MWPIVCLSLSFAAGLQFPLKPIATPAASSTDPVALDLYPGFPVTYYYEVEVNIGTPAVTFDLALDTTVPYIAVADVSCTSCNVTQRFDRKQTSTFRVDEDFTGDGLTGVAGVDQASLEDYETALVPKQGMVVVSDDPQQRLEQKEGLFGLAPIRASQARPSFVQSLKSQKLITQAVVAVYLSKVNQPAISFGSWDLAQYATRPNFIYIDTDTSGGLWEFTISEAALGPVSLQSLPSKAVLDSTQVNLVIPQAVYDVVKSDICRRVTCFSATDNSVSFMCSDVPESGLFNLTFVLGGTDIDIPWDAYMNQVYRKKTGTKCYLAMEPGKGDDWVLGTPFMFSYYLLFDYENGRLGLAPANQETSTWLYWLLGSMAAFIFIVLSVFCYLDSGCCCSQPSDLKQPLLG